MKPAALELLDRIAAAGLDVEPDSAGRVVVGPRERLTPELREAIRANRDVLAALADPEALAAWPVERHQALSDALVTVGTAELARIVELLLRLRMSAAAGGQIATAKARGPM